MTIKEMLLFKPTGLEYLRSMLLTSSKLCNSSLLKNELKIFSFYITLHTETHSHAWEALHLEEAAAHLLTSSMSSLWEKL